MLLIGLARMWLTADEDILARYASYDDLWYIRSAAVAYWGVEKYDQLSAMRPPLYPLWLWANMHLGIPQRIAIDGAFVASAMLLAYALRRAGMPRFWTLLTFAVIIFTPEPFRLFRLIQSDALNIPLMTALCAVLLLVYQTRGSTRWAIAAGTLAGLFALTRGEGMVLGAAAIAFTGALLLLGAWSRHEGAKRAAIVAIRAMLIPLVVVMAITHAVKFANNRVFGVYATAELSAPGHAGMMKALTRIRPTRPIEYVAISRESIDLACQVSPAMRELKPFLDGEVAQRWHNVTLLRRTGLPEGEILSGFTHWALREAAFKAGKHTSGRDADAYYQRVADEINSAIDRGELRQRLVLSSYLDPDISTWLPRLPAALLAVWRSTYVFGEVLPPPMDAIEVNPKIAAEFNTMCCRQPGLARESSVGITGEIFAPVHPAREIRITNANGMASLALTALPATQPRSATTRPVYQGTFSLNVPRAVPLMPVQWRIVFGDGSIRRISRMLPKSPQPFAIPDLPGGRVQLTQVNVITPEPTARLQARRWLADAYAFVIPSMIYGGLGVFSLAVVIRRTRTNGLWVGCVAILAFAVLSRFGLFAIIDASSWHGDQPRYVFPAVPAMLACGMLLISGAFAEIRAAVRRKPAGSSVPIAAGETHV